MSVNHIFVLILENRSFDHMLGFSGITGHDPAGKAAEVNGLAGTESNSYHGTPYPVTKPADGSMLIDPAHEFLDVVEQLCGETAIYMSGGPYPPINNSGFVANYAAPHPPAHSGAPDNFGEILKCFDSPNQLPVLNALAKEFALLDNWFSSMPGPTWPNRFFAHAASSGGLDHSPSTAEVIEWELGLPTGFSFQNGTIFDALTAARKPWRIYSGDGYPSVAALKHIHLSNVVHYDQFAQDVSSAAYPYAYTFIEPNYGDVKGGTYKGGNSQHPLDSVTPGEELIKSTYEAIRNSPLWNESLLIITWDEHGGFYDHCVPGSAVAPGDNIDTPGPINQNGFSFTQYGPRVPAVAVSPLIPKNTIDHRIYDHASIPATIEKVFVLPPLTQRDKAAANLTTLLTLASPRQDTPATLPNPAPLGGAALPVAQLAIAVPSEADPVDKGRLPGFLHVALKADLDTSPDQREKILARVKAIRTRADARQYMDEVRAKVTAAQTAAIQDPIP